MSRKLELLAPNGDINAVKAAIIASITKGVEVLESKTGIALKSSFFAVYALLATP